MSAEPTKSRGLFGRMAAAVRATFFHSVDAVDHGGRRRIGSGRVSSKDAEVPDRKRSTLTSTAREVETNFSVAGWAIRKHVDFVATHSFHATSGNDTADVAVEAFMRRWTEADSCDVAGRHDLPQLVRIIEAVALSAGDALIVRLASGQIQVIEGDRIKTPPAIPEGWTVVNGVHVDGQGRAIDYAVHKRDGRSLSFERWVPASSSFLYGAFDRIDQVRGVSPFVSALAPLEDVYEGFTYALAKLKVSQLFGLKLLRARDSRMPRGDGAEESADEAEDMQIVFGTKPLVLDLDPEMGEDAAFLENKTPAVEFRDFCAMMIGVGLKSIDIPFCFFDEAHTNFFGSRAALLLYLKSCEAKRARVRRLLNNLTRWRLSLAVERRELILPAGITVESMQWEWIAAGLAWWDPSKEIRGDVQAIAAGLRTRREIRRERFGDDWFEVARQLKEEEDYLAKIELTTVSPGPGLFNPDVAVQAN